jgi:hypothetical protein
VHRFRDETGGDKERLARWQIPMLSADEGRILVGRQFDL